MGVTTSRLSRDALIEKYDGQAPRYTRYPTVAQFTPEVTPEIYSAWLKGLPDEEPVGKRESMWMSWLHDSEAVCTVLAIAEEIRIGKVIAWEAVRP